MNLRVGDDEVDNEPDARETDNKGHACSELRSVHEQQRIESVALAVEVAARAKRREATQARQLGDVLDFHSDGLSLRHSNDDLRGTWIRRSVV